MSTSSEALDISIIWIKEREGAGLPRLDLPEPIPCASFSEALERTHAEPPRPGARAWIQIGDAFFGPAHVEALRRILGGGSTPVPNPA